MISFNHQLNFSNYTWSIITSSVKTLIPTFVWWCNFLDHCFCSSKQVWSSDDISSSRVLWNLSAESKIYCCRSSFMGTEMESYCSRHNIRPISLGPGTPWPNRAEASIRMFKKQVSLMLLSLKDDPLLANITYKQLLRQACISRNTMVTHGGVTPIELAFGRRPVDITTIELVNPAQLTTEAPAPERQIEALRSLGMRKFLEAKQSDDLRRDIASKLQLSDGPFFPGDKVYYWTEDKSKIKSDDKRKIGLSRW